MLILRKATLRFTTSLPKRLCSSKSSKETAKNEYLEKYKEKIAAAAVVVPLHVKATRPIMTTNSVNHVKATIMTTNSVNHVKATIMTTNSVNHVKATRPIKTTKLALEPKSFIEETQSKGYKERKPFSLYLNSILNVEKIKSLPSKEISEIWNAFFAQKEAALSATLTGATYAKLRTRSLLYPMVLLALFYPF
jgi:hypothetical protein